MPIYAEIKKDLVAPDGVKLELDTKTGVLTVTGPLGSLTRKFVNPKIKIERKANNISLFCKQPRRKDNALIGTWAGHINNMYNGVTNGFEFKMKIVYSHFI